MEQPGKAERENNFRHGCCRCKQWPVEPPSDWIAWVNRAETAEELEAIRISVKRGRPYGDDRWQQRTATRWVWNPPCARAAASAFIQSKTPRPL